MEERFDKLGFVPQKESIYNSFLVYGDKIDEESLVYLAEIKTNLGKAILFQSLDDIASWARHLSKYIRLYGRKFSKEDHIHFIQVCYELLTIPDVELNFVKQISILLSSLLKKTELLTRDDLLLPWRPLYDLYENIFFKSYESFGMILIPCNLEPHVKAVIRVCNPYFSLESTQEILDEFRPLMCPYDSEMDKAINYFELFLCTTLPPNEHHRGFRLWLNEFLSLWGSWHAVPSWENIFLLLISRLAKDNIGYIDWEPHIPMIFTRLLRSFNLPGRSQKFQILRVLPTFDTFTVATLLASMLGKGSSCQLHIDRLFKSLESFYHPSNVGRWLVKIQKLMQKLPLAVIQRLHRERYMKASWTMTSPEESKLTDQEVTDFVKSIVPAALLSMFSKRGCMDSSVALQSLGTLRPELVIPQLLDRLYSSLETLTEPHRLTAALHCIVTVSRPLVIKSKYYPGGRNHIMPLLMGALPGIDPNDIRKCMVTFQFISSLVSLILIVDCSGAADNPELSEEDRQLCIATAAFEDFVLQFMDRIFVLIENSCLGNLNRLDRNSERQNPEENFMEIGLYSTFGALITQSSPEICKVALHKLYNFVTSHIFEIKVSGKFAAHMCRVICRVNPELGLKAFLPHFAKLILDLTESDEIFTEEKLDDELLFSMLIMSEIVRTDGKFVIQYQDYIVKVLGRTLSLVCKEGYKLACFLLEYTLKSYTSIVPLDTGIVPRPWVCHTAENAHLYLNDWGKAGDLNDLKISFHNPSEEEMVATQTLLDLYLVREIERLKQWSEKDMKLHRDTVHRSLDIILSGLRGSTLSLPTWEEKQISLKHSSLPIYQPHALECGVRGVLISGMNGRQYICQAIRQILVHITENFEDDTTSLKSIIKIYQLLIFNWGFEKEKFESRWKSFSVIKNLFENKLYGQKKHTRNILIDRVQLQHERRMISRYGSFFTDLHRLIITDLMKLSTSHYSEVRKNAQNILRNCLSCFNSSHRVIFPHILELLKKDPVTYHEEFKGVLHVILGSKQQNTLLKLHDWDEAVELFPALVSSKHSEKPSIIKLLGAISISIEKNFPTHQLEFEIPSNCLEVAKHFWSESKPTPLSPILSDAELIQRVESLNLCNEKRQQSYLRLMQSLIDLLKSGNLHWRHYNLALTILVVLVRPDSRVPKEGVELFVSHLIHETIAVRKLAIQGLTCILKQQKRKNTKIVINPLEENAKVTSVHSLMLKSLSDTASDSVWLQYNSTNHPNTLEKWNSRHFVHMTHLGYYTYPKEFKVHARDCNNLNKTFDELAEEEKPIYEAFSKQAYVDKLISFLSLEDKKDHDKFDYKKFYLFKLLFCNFGDAFLPLFLNHLDRMIEDKQESVQRCAAEIIAGVLASCKHWDFHKTHSLKEKFVPLLKKMLNNITTETISDWITAITSISGCRDPNKYYWVFETFMQEPQSVENGSGSFLESSWFCLLISLLSQQEWRVCELLQRALVYIQPKLDHSYQNVREKLGNFLVYIFMFDIPNNNKIVDFVPKIVPFLNSILPRLSILETSDQANEAESMQPLVESPERKSAKNLFRTLCCWITSNGEKSLYPVPPVILKLLPVLCVMANDSTDESFQRDCKVALAILGQSLLNSESIIAAINIIKEIASGNSWHSRISVASYLQTMVFSNLYSVMQNESWIKDIYDMVLMLLQDENVEVRESAAETLCGFLHCEFFKISDEFLTMLKEKCCRKLKYKIASSNGPKTIEPEELRERHAGVLGLCACVNAYPYDVPEFLPDILVLLGEHLNDPQPISATIKKTLSSFRRTHHDNWRDHKLKFTDDQLAVITDLLVSPSYYA